MLLLSISASTDTTLFMLFIYIAFLFLFVYFVIYKPIKYFTRISKKHEEILDKQLKEINNDK